MSRLLMEAQIFVLSTNFEALPISILEAMRAASPVVATDVRRHRRVGAARGDRPAG